MAVALNQKNTAANPGSSTVACTLTGVPQDDIIIVAVDGEATSAQGAWSVSSVTATGLTFTQRATKYDTGRNSGFQGSETWWAVVPSGGFTGTITATLNKTIDLPHIHAFSVTGADTTSPFGAGSPVTASTSTTFAAVQTTFSADANTFVFVTAGSAANSATFYGVVASGFTNVNTQASSFTNFQHSAVDYDIPASPLSSATVGWGTTTYQFWTLIADALVPPAPSTSGTGSLSLSGSAGAAAPVTAAASLTLTGSADSPSTGSGTASLTLSGSGTGTGPTVATGSASLTLGATATAAAEPVPVLIPGSSVGYRYRISDSATAAVIAELPLTDVTFSRVLSGCGQFSGSLSVWHPACTRAVLGFDTADSDREITVVRDDVPIWNGPVTGISGGMADGTVQINAREASFYLQKRTLEINKSYDGTDVFDAVRDLLDYMTSKVADGSDGMGSGDDIVAALPRWFIDPASATAGANISDPSPPTFYGSARHLISDCFEALAADPTTGFEWRMDYAVGAHFQEVRRTVTLGYPNLGSVLTTQLSEAVVADYGRTGDWERGATRVHALYGGGVKTLQSSAAVTDGIILTEVVDDITDITKPGVATSYAKNLRRLSRPPVRTYSVAFTPSTNGLQFDFANLGDTVPLAFATPDIFAVTASRRVIQIDVTPASGDIPETVQLTFNIPLDDLST